MADATLARTPVPGPASPPSRDTGSFAALEPLLRRHHHRSDSLIEVLHQAQELYGYLSDPLLRHVATSLDLPLSRVLGTASFYHLFRFRPAALHSCIVCTGTACEVKGSARLIVALEREFGIRIGTTRADGSLSLGAVRCLGTCSGAPVVVIDGVVRRHQSEASLLAAVRELAP